MWHAANFRPPPLRRRGGLWGGRDVSPVAMAMALVLSAGSAAAGSASTTQSPYMGQLLKTGLFSLFSAHLVPFATFH